MDGLLISGKEPSASIELQMDDVFLSTTILIKHMVLIS